VHILSITAENNDDELGAQLTYLHAIGSMTCNIKYSEVTSTSQHTPTTTNAYARITNAKTKILLKPHTTTPIKQPLFQNMTVPAQPVLLQYQCYVIYP